MPKNKQQKYVQFIDDRDFTIAAEHVISAAQKALDGAEEKLYENAIDPFSAIFDSSVNGISLSSWLKTEKTRQVQKTLQNALGDFHEMIIGSMEGWINLPKGSVVDVENKNKKIIAEIKNKYNTTKGNHKKVLYDDLKKLIGRDPYKNFVGYYVEIIPKNNKSYDEFFTPSDNLTKKRRSKNKKIRRIDGKTFYAVASGYEDALWQIYKALPQVLADILKKKPNRIKDDKLFEEIFKKTF